MDFIITRCCLSILILVCAIEANNTNSDGDSRVPRGMGRVVKLYSGVRPDPIVCTTEGFREDPKDCTIFYRCTKSQRGKFTAFRFQCPPGTVYDPETEVCNHPQNTKRSECGGKEIISSHYDLNEIEEINELPSPISTKLPSYSTMTAKPVINAISSPAVQSTTTIQSVSTTKRQETILNPGYSTTPSHSPFISPATSAVNIQQSTSGDICTSDGFMGDSVNCHKFYRCVGNQYSGFTKYEFSCSEPTIWDDEIKSCNHPWAVKKSRCGRNHILDDSEGSTKSNPSSLRTTTDSVAILNANKTIQSQLQIAYGDRVHQTQTQISNGAAIQNQTQIFYGDRVNKTKSVSNKQNQTQISYGSAVSQSQYQIGFGDGVVQTQVQIDHSKQTSQSQIQIVESTTIPTKPSSTQEQNPIKNQQNQNGSCSESGFMGDPYDCKKFYRCVDNGRGGYTRHEFSCGEGTSWDQSIEACNHAWAVKECGGKVTGNGTQETTNKPTTQSYSTTSKATENILTSSEITQSSDAEDVGYNQVTMISMGSTPSTTTNVVHRIDNDCTSSGFIGDPTNCQKFYSCVENGNGGYTKHEFKCSEGTLWDSDIGGCNHAQAVKRCGGHSVSTTIETTSFTTPALSTTPTSAVTHVVTPQIDDYDTGYGGQKEQSSPITTIRTTKIPQDSSILNNDCQSSGFMGDKNDCKKFYRCVSNGDGSYTRYEFMCGEGTVWDSKIESCNHAWAVDSCKNSSITISNEVTTQKGMETNSEEIGDGYITPENKDSELSTKKPTVSTTTTKTTHSLEQNKCSKNGFIGDITDCKKFYRCVDNGDGSYTQYEFTCGEGTVWDQKIEACNHAWAVDKCGAYHETDHVEATTSAYNVTVRDEEPVHAYPAAEYPIQKDEVTHETTQSTSIMTSASPSTPCYKDGFIGDKRDCKVFYRCVNDGNGNFSKIEFKCGEGTVWDQSIGACNHAWAVKNCGAVNDTLNTKNESTTQGVFISSSEYYTDNSSPASDINENEISDECKKEGFAGDTKDCKRFYRCVDNGRGGFTKYEFKCGEGTYWNEKIEACDHASSENLCQENENTHVTKKPQHINDEAQFDTTTTITTLSTIENQENISVTKKPQSSGAPCASEGFFGDQDDCRKFYRCVDDGSGRYSKYGFTCGDGTVWDQELLTCVHKSERNNCLHHSTVTSNRPPEPTHNNEDSFISSATHVPHETSTATTDVPKQISTENTTMAYQCTTEGFYANPTDCRKFIRCVSDGKGSFTKYDFACGDGTVWIQEILACDHDDGTATCHTQNEWTSRPQTNVESSTVSNSAVNSTTVQNQNTNQSDEDNNAEVTKGPQILKDDCQSEGFYGDKDDCQKYYRCVANNNNGYTKYEFVCGEGTAWDSNLQTCNHNSANNCRVSNQTENQTEFVVHDEISDSTQSGTPSSTPASSTESKESTSTNKDNCEKAGFFGNTQDCAKFYRCVDDGKGGLTKYDFTCGDGTIWDQDLLTCNHPQDVVNPSCERNQGETSENTTTPPETSSTSKTTETSSTTTQSSQSTTTTTENSSNCTQVESSKNPGNKNVTCTKAGYYPDPSDCKKFYRCVDWDGNGEKFSVYFFECGEGTIWDPALDTCNHEESVYPPRNCSNSQISSSGQETTTTEESTTQEATTSEKTTTESTSSETTTQQSTTSEKTTTEQTTSSEHTTIQQTTTSEKTTTEQLSTSEPTTTQQSTTTDKTTTTQPTTTEQTTTKEPTSSETTTTEQYTTTTEGTTTQQVDSTTETTTEQATTTEAVKESTTTDKTTTQESTTSTTTEESSTTDSATEQSTTTEQSSTESGTSTTESNPQTSTTENQQETTTDHSSHSSSCPETEDDQYLFVCPTSFKRHPKYCNIFYQCTEDDDTHEVKVAVFNCPNNTIYDESKVQCVEEDKADKKCDGEIAARRRVKRLGASNKEPIVVTKDSQKCVMEGHVSFEKNSECSPAFLKCERTKSGALRGYVHRCPQNYVYWSISRRCEREEVVRDCKRTINNWSGRWEIPIDRQNVAW